MTAVEPGRGSTQLALVVVVAVLVLAGVFSGVYLSSSLLQRTVTTTETSFATTTSTLTSVAVVTGITTVVTQYQTIEASSTYRSGGYSGGPVVQTCVGSATYVSSSSCTLGQPVTKGHLLVVELSDVLPDGVNDSLGNGFTLVASALLTDATYYIQVYVAVASSSGMDTFSVTGSGNFPNMVVHELNLTSVAASSELSGDSASPAVNGYIAPAGWVVMGVALVANHGETVSAGPGQTLMGQYPGVIGDEYSVSSGGYATSPFELSDQQTWGEVSVAFS